MGLTNSDRLFILSTVKSVTTEVLAPIAKQVQTNTDVLFGPMKDDGLIKDVSQIKKDREDSKLKMYKMLGFTGGIASVISYGLGKLISLIFH